MNPIFQSGQLLFAIFYGWVNERQQKTIEFQNAQIETLLQKLGKKRILLTDDQRRLLAVKAKAIGRKALMQLTTIVTPDTILRWHRELVAKKWDYSDRRTKKPGRPSISAEIEQLVLRFARENPTWGYDRISGALANLGHDISDQSVGNILKANGLEPAGERKKQTTWKTFLKAHWDTLFAVDFTTVEVWSPRGLVTFYVMIVMELKTRRVQIAGVTPNPHADWMRQGCRELTNEHDGFLVDASHLIVDRDNSFLALRDYLKTKTDINPVVLPPKSPNLNAFQERFFRSLKSESFGSVV